MHPSVRSPDSKIETATSPSLSRAPGDLMTRRGLGRVAVATLSDRCLKVDGTVGLGLKGKEEGLASKVEGLGFEV